MIVGYVGTPGSGKTYEAVSTVLANLKRGRRVYTNIDGLDVDTNRRFIQDNLGLDDYEFNKRLVFLDKKDVNRFWEIAVDGSMIVLDEVHKNFSNREWNTEKNKQFADWASTHRHHGFDLILITQDIEKVEKHVRSLLEWTYFFRKVNFFGGAVQRKYICYSYSGDDHNGKPLAKNIRTYNPFIFKCYKSYATEDAKEVGFMTHINILKHPVFFAIPAVIAFFFYMANKSTLFSGNPLVYNKPASVAAKVKATYAAKPQPSVAYAAPLPAVPPALPPVAAPLPPLAAVAPPVMRKYSAAAPAPVPPPHLPMFVGGKPTLKGYIFTGKDGSIHLTDNPQSIPRGTKYRVKEV